MAFVFDYLVYFLFDSCCRDPTGAAVALFSASTFSVSYLVLSFLLSW
jgi:hypothetical protein